MMSQNFRAIFVDNQMADEISALALKMAKPSKIVYTTQELIDISKQPSFEEYRAQYVAELKSQAHKYSWIEEIDRGRENKFIESYYARRNLPTNGKKEPPRQRNDETRYRNSTQKSSPLTWRSGNNNNLNNNNNMNHTGYDRSRNNHQNNNNRHNNRNNGRGDTHRYGNSRSNYYDNDDDEEEEPEWMTGGPDSMMDFIELRGFDDDPNNEDNLLSSTENLSTGASTNSDRRDSRSVHDFNDFGLGDSTKSSNLNLNEDSDMMFGSSAPSFFNENGKISNAGFSRAGRWFRKPMENSSATSESAATASSVSTKDPCSDNLPSSATSVQSLLQKMAASGLGNLPRANIAQSAQSNIMNIDLSKVTSVSELEANLPGMDKAKNPQENFETKKPDIGTPLNVNAATAQLNSLLNNSAAAAVSPQIPSQPSPRMSLPIQANPMLMQQMMNQGQYRQMNPNQQMFSKQIAEYLAKQYMMSNSQGMPPQAFMNPDLLYQQMICQAMAEKGLDPRNPQVQQHLQQQMFNNLQQQMQNSKSPFPPHFRPQMAPSQPQPQHHQQQSQQNMNPMNNPLNPNGAMAQQQLPINMAAKASEIVKAEKALKNSTLTPTSVFRKTRKTNEQAKPPVIAADKTSSMNTMLQQMNAMKISNNNDDSSAISDKNVPIIASNSNPLALFSSLNGFDGSNLRKPMPSMPLDKAVTLDELERR